MSTEIQDNIQMIKNGETVIGIELGSTRIKTVLLNRQNEEIASGDSTWENQLIHNVWTYSLDDVWIGLRESYQAMKADVQKKYHCTINEVSAIGISGMMHGYLVFDQETNLLVPFRTWRNTMTQQASDVLSEKFQYHIPQRYSISHLYQALMNHEEHTSQIDYMTTLSGYVHWKLTGQRVLGIGDASGMFPIDYENHCYHSRMVEQFDELAKAYGFSKHITSILPHILMAGEEGGTLTEEGAKWLDESGELKSGIRLCPPEGDAETGMVATNTITPNTANVSIGTSIFANFVLETEPKKMLPEIDIVATPDGKPVGMAHANNGTSDLNAWVSLFEEVLEQTGHKVSKDELYKKLYESALSGDADCGGLITYGYLSGEHITGLSGGCPLFARKENSIFTLSNFMRTHILSMFAVIRIGYDILREEDVKVNAIYAHGGIFKTKRVGQQLLAAALQAPVTVMETAQEGGAYGIALLASFLSFRKSEESLSVYLDRLFSDHKGITIQPQDSEVQGFNEFMHTYKEGLQVERLAAQLLN